MYSNQNQFYNNGFNNRNVGYGYYQMPQQQIQQPMYSQSLSMQEIPIQAVRFMNETEARAYVLLPNQKELLIVKEKGIAFLKGTDSLGQSSCQIFNFNSIDDIKSVETNNFITKEELNDFVSKKDFEELKAKFEELKLYKNTGKENNGSTRETNSTRESISKGN